MALGLYISVPFCRTKCSYCNFASGVFSRAVFERYVDRVCHDIDDAAETARRMGAGFEKDVDSVYLGGGTPTVLDPRMLARMFGAVGRNFTLLPDAEITVECAPGTLTPAMVETLLRCGVNRVSLGVQSFVDQEAAAVGRLHTQAKTVEDIVRLRRAGISNVNVDLIAGLPHQTAQSWQSSLDALLAAGVPHASIYMLEVDEDSRLGRELIAGGSRYHAHFVPDENLTAELYEAACHRLHAAGIWQYEISNFAREGCQSRHNLKYWTRRPYLGFGVDAHSMLEASGEAQAAGLQAVRFSAPGQLEQYIAGAALKPTTVSWQNALEETFFLGLRLNVGVDLRQVSIQFGAAVLARLNGAMHELEALGLTDHDGDRIRLTSRGRLLANEVFEQFLAAPAG